MRLFWLIVAFLLGVICAAFMAAWLCEPCDADALDLAPRSQEQAVARVVIEHLHELLHGRLITSSSAGLSVWYRT